MSSTPTPNLFEIVLKESPLRTVYRIGSGWMSTSKEVGAEGDAEGIGLEELEVEVWIFGEGRGGRFAKP